MGGVAGATLSYLFAEIMLGFCFVLFICCFVFLCFLGFFECFTF